MSKPQVTITLGRTGQVVTKGGKRSMGERFESNSDCFLLPTNKRYRGEDIKWSPGLDRVVNGPQIAQNDLRLKLMRKRISRRTQNAVEGRKMDPHKNMSKSIQRPASSHMLSQKLDPNGSNSSRIIPPKEITNDVHGLDSLVRLAPQAMRGLCVLSVPGAFDNTASTSTSQAGIASRVAPPSGIMQKVSRVAEEPLTVDGFLHSLGLGKYTVLFQAEEIDMTVLKKMGDKDLIEMGIPMGPRKKILIALFAPPERQTPTQH